jgi:hypothetical protein
MIFWFSGILRRHQQLFEVGESGRTRFSSDPPFQTWLAPREEPSLNQRFEILWRTCK